MYIILLLLDFLVKALKIFPFTMIDSLDYVFKLLGEN